MVLAPDERMKLATPSAPDQPPLGAAVVPAGRTEAVQAEGAVQRVVKVRRDYNSWVARETMEDYALRFTPRSFRKWSELRVANTAFGAASFLVLEAVGETSSEKVHVPERPGQVDRHIGSTEKMSALTGWRARTAFADGLEQTVAWYRENEAWWRGVLGQSRHASSS